MTGVQAVTRATNKFFSLARRQSHKVIVHIVHELVHLMITAPLPNVDWRTDDRGAFPGILVDYSYTAKAE